MFDKVKFANILRKISNTYDNQREFSEKSKINRTYLSQYLNTKLEQPPKPEILERLANASRGITNYSELMNICGYFDKEIEDDLTDSLKSLEIDKCDLDKALTAFIENFITIPDNYTINIYDMEDTAIYYAYEILRIYYFKLINNELNNARYNSSSEKKDYFEIAEINAWEKMKKILNNIDEAEIITSLTADEKVSKFLSNVKSQKKFYMCPVYGKISAGIPNWAEECLEGYLPIDPNLMGIINPEECFFLKVNGESMNKVIQNGAYALIRKQDVVENGEIAAVLVNGFEATLKKFTKQGELVILEPISDDPLFTTQVYNKDTDIKILGKYIGKFEMNK